MPARTHSLGIAQVPQTSDLGDNLREIEAVIDCACEAGAEMLVFPETALTGYGPVYHESSAEFDPEAVNAAVEELRARAREVKMRLVIGTHLPLEDGWSNSALLLGAGKAARYDKVHLYGRDMEFYRAGREPSRAVAARGARVGMQICFDLRFPEPFRRLAAQKAEVIVVPSHIHGKNDMWKGPVIEAHVRSRAAENGRFVVFVNAAGPNQNVPSMIANPRGELVALCRRGRVEVQIARLDLGEVNDDLLRARRVL